MAEVAHDVQYLTLFIYSTQPIATVPSKGRYKQNFHSDSKATVEEHIYSKLPGLLEKMSSV